MPVPMASSEMPAKINRGINSKRALVDLFKSVQSFWEMLDVVLEGVPNLLIGSVSERMVCYDRVREW